MWRYFHKEKEGAVPKPAERSGGWAAETRATDPLSKGEWRWGGTTCRGGGGEWRQRTHLSFAVYWLWAWGSFILWASAFSPMKHLQHIMPPPKGVKGRQDETKSLVPSKFSLYLNCI